MVVYRGPEGVDIPELDLLTLLFDSEYTLSEEDTVLHAEAANPCNSVTKAQARDLIKSIAYSLRECYGVGKKGPGRDVVVCTSNGNPLVPIFFYGVIAAGGIFSSASAAFTRDELVRQIRTGNGMVLACTADHEEKTLQAAQECNIPTDRVLRLDYAQDRWTMTSVGTKENLIGNTADTLDWMRIDRLRDLEDTVTCLLFSSGTTGPPKGVMLTQRNLVASIVLSLQPGLSYMEQKRQTRQPFELRTLGHLPVAHIAGIQQYFLNPGYLGGTVYWLPEYDFHSFIEANRRCKITYLFTVPPIFLQIAKSTDVTNHLNAMQLAFSGAAPLGADLQRSASEKMGNAPITQTWGLTETTGSVTLLRWGQVDDTGSVSELLPNMSLEIKDDEGNEVPEGEAGELVVSGPLVTKGYYKNEEATRSSIRNGRFFTGDVGYVRDGLIYIVDRKKELIKYKGLQVAPAELEALLLSHERILDAAVIGVEYQGTEAPRAYIVKQDPALTAAEVASFISSKAASYKQLRGGIVFIDAIPKSPSGKILRKDLQAKARSEMEANAHKAKL